MEAQALSWQRGTHRLVGALLIGLACQAQASVPALADAQPGDLIFREGTEAVSAAVMQVDGGGFSHVGMLVAGPDGWQVVHATPAELPGRLDGVVLDSLAFFLDPARASHYAVYRVTDVTPAQRTQAVAAAQARLGTPFRLKEAGGTYCTTLLYEAWQQAGLDLDVSFTPLAIPLMAGDYLLPSNLLASPHLAPLSTP